MESSLIDSLVPAEPVLADDCQFEILGPEDTVFRSPERFHVWKGAIYRDLGLALLRGLKLSEILDAVGAAHTLLALNHLTKARILQQRSRRKKSRPRATAGPSVFGDSAAPYRTSIDFLPRPSAPFGLAGPGFHVYGRGFNEAAARTGCRAEAAERASMVIDRQRCLQIHFAQLGPAAVPPWQLLPPGDPGYDDSPGEWTPAHSLISGRVHYIPADYCFVDYDRPKRIIASSTGCASGSDRESAILHGLFELVERDSLRRWQWSMLPARPVRAETFESSFLKDVRQYLGQLGRSLVVLDITSIPEIPAFVAMSCRRDRSGGVLGVAAHFDALSAITSATLEMGMALNCCDTMRFGSRSLRAEIGPDWQRSVAWTMPKNARDYQSFAESSAVKSVTHAAKLLSDRGQEFLLIDLTAPSAAFLNVRVIVPGLYNSDPAPMYRLVEDIEASS